MRTVPIARITIDRPQQGWNVDTTIPNWLRDHAHQFETWGDEYTRGTFRGGYFGNLNRRVATLRISAAGALSPGTRKRIAKWMRSRATWVEKHGRHYDRRWFTQEFSL